MNHLLIETSGRGGFVGLIREDRHVQSAWLDESRKHARDLAAQVRAILQAESLSPTSIASVRVSLGPGSYTGLRVGLASAKAFAYAVGCDLIAVPTFHAIVDSLSLAGRASDGGQHDPSLARPANVIEVIADGLQGLVYAQRFQRQNGVWQNISELTIQPAAQWTTTLASVDLVIGPGVAIHQGVDDSILRPTPIGLWLASQRCKPLTKDELFAIEPLYLRGSSAEEKKKAQSVNASMASEREP
jgi:tRNA threonylcarbamoyladenosine biosynthesis protein TsaB